MTGVPIAASAWPGASCPMLQEARSAKGSSEADCCVEAETR
jgi:hypothetical protein